MGNKPVYEAKMGAVRAAVWENPGKNGKPFYSVKFTTLYRDADGNWKDGSSYTREQLPLLMKVADSVHTFLYEKRNGGDQEVNEE